MDLDCNMEHLVNVACVSVPIVNDNPLNDLGYTHAPQTFYVSTKGYGILVNTARYTTFLCGSNQKGKMHVPQRGIKIK